MKNSLNSPGLPPGCNPESPNQQRLRDPRSTKAWPSAPLVRSALAALLLLATLALHTLSAQASESAPRTAPPPRPHPTPAPDSAAGRGEASPGQARTTGETGEKGKKAQPGQEGAGQGAELKSEELFEPPKGEDGSHVQVGNLIYARTQSSVCFSDHFLQLAEQDSSIKTSRRFHAVKTNSREIFRYPFVIMTGEGTFTIPEDERKNLKAFLENGGLLLASASCSSPDWDRSFRIAIAQAFPDHPLKQIPMNHQVFKTVYEIKALEVRHGKPKPLEAIELNGRLAVIYSADGLNDTSHVTGCCCCGGNEINNCSQINVNILAYALTH